MATKLRGGGNSSVLQLDYGDPNVIKKLLRNWSGMEALSLRGDRNATCVLVDLQEATGIDLGVFQKEYFDLFISKRNKQVLTEAQFIAISFVLVLGYSQPEVAYIFGISQQAVGKSISSGAWKISQYLENGMYREEAPDE